MCASAPDWLHLGEDETVVWRSRPHPVALGTSVVVGFGLFVLGLGVIWLGAAGLGALAWVGLLVAAVGAGVVVVRYVFWTNTHYVITTEQLYEKRGVVSRDVVQFRLDRIQNTTLRQSVFGRLLGYADLTVYTAGSDNPELTFTMVPAPGEANAALSEQLGDFVDGNPSPTGV